MRALLDTHAFLWWIGGDSRLSRRSREVIADPANQILFSAVSGWEIVEKARRNRLDLPADPQSFVAEQISINGFGVLPLLLDHALHVYSLPAHHKDLFDRMLIAQAQAENIALLTADRAIARYSVQILW